MSLVRRWLIMTVLAFSGGIIFLLPFLREVYYRPMADAMSLTNTQLGWLMSVFGFVSMITYFPGGWLADRFSGRKLMSVSLLSTGLVGLYYATLPSFPATLAIHAFWGVSITLLFWAAMIKVTRGWAPPEQQGRAFGTLEMMRGVGEVAASSALLWMFSMLGESDMALSTVITVLSLTIIVLGVLSWLVIEDTARAGNGAQQKVGWTEIRKVLSMPVIWLIAIVIIAAYCAYWGSFQFTPFASDIFLTTAATAGAIGVGKMWLKPIAALVAGFAADRFGVAATISALFGVLIASFVGFATLPTGPSWFQVMLVNVAIASIAVFALRGIYFALLEEGGVPLAVTGTAGGIVSAVGFTPDVFMPMLGGVLLDRYPGMEGYRYYYLSVAGICAGGLAAALLIYFRYVKPAAATADRDSYQPAEARLP